MRSAGPKPVRSGRPYDAKQVDRPAARTPPGLPLRCPTLLTRESVGRVGMIRTTPFHARLQELDTQGLYTHWQGFLSPLRYTHAPKHEYFAVRNSVGVFDTSPLFKYRLTGPDAEKLLAGMMVRDIRTCRPGRAQYTIWCDDRGFVMEDGVVFRHAEDDFLLTSARPNQAWLTQHRGRLRVEIEDVSDDFGILAVQGPRARQV